MQFEAKMIEDSISPSGVRLSTFQLCYPRFIHAEAKTHRVLSNNGEEYEQIVLTQDAGFMSDKSLSRNASSSRAIPIEKMISQVRLNMAMPVHWGANQKGMQAREELTGPALEEVQQLWRNAAFQAASIAERMMVWNAHKQVANRILEPFQWMHVIVTATEWVNFFELRDHGDADPNIHLLAKLMKAAQAESTPQLRASGNMYASQWHLPYVTAEERHAFNINPTYLAKISAARCARVSYLTHDGKAPDPAKDLELYDRLVGSRPLHASPVEHQAWPMPRGLEDDFSGNFRGWNQFRKQIESEMEP